MEKAPDKTALLDKTQLPEKTQAAAGAAFPDIDATMRGLLGLPGVEGYLLFNAAGIPLKWSPGLPFVRVTGAAGAAGGGGAGAGGGGGGAGGAAPAASGAVAAMPASVVHYAAVLDDLTARSRAAWRRLFGGGAADAAAAAAGGEEGELALLRLRTPEGELVIAPHAEATLVVSQAAGCDVGELPAT